MLSKGDKLIAKQDVAGLLKTGDIIEVDSVSCKMFSFVSENNLRGFMTIVGYEEFFEEYKEPEKSCELKDVITGTMIEDIIANSEIDVQTVFNKCTIVTCKLPNGFVIVESSACVNPSNYDEDLGIEICMDKIVNKVWELEEYRLQSRLYELNEEIKESKCLCNECCLS